MALPFDSEILKYYERGLELGGLESSFSRWEKVRTMDLLERFLPPAPSVILDVGGGAGAYAFPLAERGYTVDLIDPVPLHMEQAKQIAEGRGAAPRSFQIGDARAIPCEDGAADAVLLLGPLYHLTDARDRVAALREARRALRVGGVVMAAAISRFASAMDGIGRRLIRDPRFVGIVKDDLRTGQHRNETDNADYFTTAFFHRPEELRTELVEAGFAGPEVRAIEGPIWNIAEPESDGERAALMSVMRELESEPALIGASAHMMAIGVK